MVNGIQSPRFGIAVCLLALAAIACALPLPKRETGIVPPTATLANNTPVLLASTNTAMPTDMPAALMYGCWNIRKTPEYRPDNIAAQVCDVPLTIKRADNWVELGGQYDGLYICAKAFGMEADCQ